MGELFRSRHLPFRAIGHEAEIHVAVGPGVAARVRAEEPHLAQWQRAIHRFETTRQRHALRRETRRQIFEMQLHGADRLAASSMRPGPAHLRLDGDDVQRAQRRARLLVGKDDDPSTLRADGDVIGMLHAILFAIRCLHQKRREGLGVHQLADFVGHACWIHKSHARRHRYLARGQCKVSPAELGC